MMMVRGIRGATSVGANSAEDIIEAVKELLREIVKRNNVHPEDIAGAFFSVTGDLNADFPARGARELGWDYVPMMCCVEIGVPGGISGIIRVMLLVNTKKEQQEIKHVYLKEAVNLRSDLVK